uniref:K Homology domain-containing protein n=1 Tax=Trichobilharzia regenti TaxID=157069 RepID=A0AA85JIW9_TRIRE|nr:unnamed protein product [Trichobilharzia regenti]
MNFIPVKILVPNSTAGMVIGKGGSYIQEIKEKTGAYVQISQKSREFNLLERCIVVAGELDQTRAAVHLILGVIAADPQSASCPNLSYHDIQGPVASVYPTGSPYAIPVIPYLSNPTALPNPPVDVNSPAGAAAAAVASMMAAASASAAFTHGQSSSQGPGFGFFPGNLSSTSDVATLAALVSNPAAGSIILPSMLANAVNGRTSSNSMSSGDIFSATGASSNTPWSNISGQTGFDTGLPDPNAATSVNVSIALAASSFTANKPQDSQSTRTAVSPPVFFPSSSFIPGPLHMSPTGLFGYPALGYGSLPSQQSHHHHLATRGIPLLSETCSSPACSTPSTLPSLLTSPSVAALAALSAAASITAATTVLSSSSSPSSPLTSCTAKSLPVLPNPGTAAAAAVLGLLPYSPPSLSSLTVGPILPAPPQPPSAPTQGTPSQILPNDPMSMSFSNIPSASSLLLSLTTESGGGGGKNLQGLQQQQSSLVLGGSGTVSSPQATGGLPSPSNLLGLHGLQYPGASGSSSSAAALPSNMVNPVGNYVAYRRVLSVPENVVNIILGHQGRSIMDLQLVTGTVIQISQKNIYVSGGQLRNITITGPQGNVQWAANVIEHIIAIEHIKRESSMTSSQQSLPAIESEHFLPTIGLHYPDCQPQVQPPLSSVSTAAACVMNMSQINMPPMIAPVTTTGMITSSTSNNNNNNNIIITGMPFSSTSSSSTTQPSSSCEIGVSRRSCTSSGGDSLLSLQTPSSDSVPVVNVTKRDETS